MHAHYHSTDVLLYFSDGLLPLLRAYYKNFFQKPLLSRNKTTLDIVTALIVCFTAVSEYCLLSPFCFSSFSLLFFGWMGGGGWGGELSCFGGKFPPTG